MHKGRHLFFLGLGVGFLRSSLSHKEKKKHLTLRFGKKTRRLARCPFAIKSKMPPSSTPTVWTYSPSLRASLSPPSSSTRRMAAQTHNQQDWDKMWSAEVWNVVVSQVFRILMPGGHLVVFASGNTVFEMRQRILDAYGRAKMPKPVQLGTQRCQTCRSGILRWRAASWS